MRSCHSMIPGVCLSLLMICPLQSLADSEVPLSKDAAKVKAVKDTAGGLNTAKEVAGHAMKAGEAAARHMAEKSIADGSVPQAAEHLGQAKTIGKAAKAMGGTVDAAGLAVQCSAGADNCQTALGQKAMDLAAEGARGLATDGYAIWRGGAAVMSTGGAVIAVGAAGIVGEVAGGILNENAKKIETANLWLKGRNVNDALLDDVYWPAWEKTSNFFKYGSVDGQLDDAYIEQAMAEAAARRRAREGDFAGIKSGNQRAYEQATQAAQAAQVANQSMHAQQEGPGFFDVLGMAADAYVQHQQKFPGSAAHSAAPQSCNKTYNTPDGCHPGHDEKSHPGGCRC